MCEDSQDNRRLEERIKNINIPVRFRADELHSENTKGYKINFIKKTIKGKIVDLSAGGLSLFSELPIGLHLYSGNAINIQFTLNKVGFEITGLVVRANEISNISKRNMFYIAVSFINLKDREEAIIRKYIQTEAGKLCERSQERVSVHLKIAFATIDESSSVKHKIRTGIGQIINLTVGGLCFSSKALFLKFGDNLKIELDIPTRESKKIDITGEVRRITPKDKDYEVEVGVSFTRLDKATKEAIIKYIRLHKK